MASLSKVEMIDQAIKDLGGDISKVTFYGCEGHTYLKATNSYAGGYALCHYNSSSVTDGLCFCTIEEFEQRKKELEQMNKQDDWLYVGAFVVRPDGFVDEVVGVSEENGVRLKYSFQHYCRSQLKPFKSEEAKTGWYDYENQRTAIKPPIGEIVLYDDYKQGLIKVKILGHHPNNGGVWSEAVGGTFAEGNSYSTDSYYCFRPLDWDKLSKRKQAIAYAMELSPDWAKLEDIFGSLYDAGVLKLPENNLK